MVLRRRKELIMWISNKIYQQVVVILFPIVRVRLCIIVLVLLCNVVMRNVGLPKSRSEIEQGLLEKKMRNVCSWRLPTPGIYTCTAVAESRYSGFPASFFFCRPMLGHGMVILHAVPNPTGEDTSIKFYPWIWVRHRILPAGTQNKKII